MSILSEDDLITYESLKKIGYHKSFSNKEAYIKYIRCVNKSNQADLGCRATIKIIKCNTSYQVIIFYAEVQQECRIEYQESFNDVSEISDLSIIETHIKDSFIDKIYKYQIHSFSLMNNSEVLLDKNNVLKNIEFCAF